MKKYQSGSANRHTYVTTPTGVKLKTQLTGPPSDCPGEIGVVGAQSYRGRRRRGKRDDGIPVEAIVA